MRTVWLLCVAATAAALIAAGPAVAGAAPARHGSAAVSAVPRPDHIVVVVEENKAEQTIVGNPAAPYINSLAGTGANFTDFYAETHPSQPNYVALFSGSTQGLTDDSCPHTFATDNLGSELLAAGDGFVGYSEGLPSVGYTGCTSGEYARKHNPWSNFSSVPGDVSQPFSAFPTDYSTLPAVSFVVPNLDDDMHDGTIAEGDTWVQNNMAGYISWAQAHNSVFVLTFDEDDGSESNKIPTVITGAGVVPGNYAETVNHYNLLRTIEDAYGLAPLGASGTASPILDIWAPPQGDQPPVPAFTSSCTGLTCALDASSSSDPDGSITSYAWTFGDGTATTGEQVSHQYAAGGTYSVQLTVTDNQSVSTTLSQSVSPVGATTVFVSDSFERTVSNGLGSADVGGAWSTVGTKTNFSVGGGTANLLLPKAASQDEGFVGPAGTDADITTSFDVSQVPVGGPVYASVSGRRVSAGTGYQSKLLFNPNGTVLIEVVRAISNSATVLKSVTVPGFTYTPGSPLQMRTQVTGTNPTLVQAKVWHTGSSQPVGWQVSATDSTAGLQAAGTTGVIAYLSGTATNAPITVPVASFLAQSSTSVQNQPPSAAFTSACSQLSCSFDGSGSTDQDGTIASYAWAFGDGASGTGATPTHAFITAGSYPVTLTVTDSGGLTGSVTHTVTAAAPPVDQPPTASFTFSCTTLTCSFDGSTSTESDGGPPVAWAWDFGDGATATGVTTTHTYASAGSWSVVLTVTDDDGLTGTVTQVATVNSSTDFASDSFDRTVSNGWGSADVGGSWTLVGSASRASVGSGTGSLRLDAGSQVECYLPSVARTDADVLVQATIAQRPTGGPLYLTAVPRRVGSGLRYGAQALLNTDGSVTLQLNRTISNAAAVLTSVKVPGLSYTGGATIEVRVEATGTAPTTLRARAWLSTSPEPSTWQVTATDSSASLQTSGSVGLVGYLSANTTNGPLTLQFSDVEAKPTGQ